MKGTLMTDELVRQLMAAGLNKQQATSVTAETLVRLLMPEDGKALIAEAKRQVTEMQQLVDSLRSDYNSLQRKMQEVSDLLLAVKDAQSEYGAIGDEKAKNVVALYGALLSMNEKAGADASESVRNAGYIVYAYLGGQAKREINTLPSTPQTEPRPVL